MSSEQIQSEIKKVVEGKGPYAFLFSFVAAVIALAQLSPDNIQTLQHIWPMLSSPAGIVLLSTPAIWSLKVILGGGFHAYLDEQKTRTRVEEGIYDKLTKLAADFEKMLADHWDDRRYFDDQLEKFSAQHDVMGAKLEKIYAVLEKRTDTLTHSGDTERLLYQEKKKGV